MQEIIEGYIAAWNETDPGRRRGLVDSLWAAEHSHIPVSRRTPFAGGGELPKQYYEAMDPFVVLIVGAALPRPV